jgi:hypothetical protein
VRAQRSVRTPTVAGSGAGAPAPLPGGGPESTRRRVVMETFAAFYRKA